MRMSDYTFSNISSGEGYHVLHVMERFPVEKLRRYRDARFAERIGDYLEPWVTGKEYDSVHKSGLARLYGARSGEVVVHPSGLVAVACSVLDYRGPGRYVAQSASGEYLQFHFLARVFGDSGEQNFIRFRRRLFGCQHCYFRRSGFCKHCGCAMSCRRPNDVKHLHNLIQYLENKCGPKKVGHAGIVRDGIDFADDDEFFKKYEEDRLGRRLPKEKVELSRSLLGVAEST